MQAEILNVLYRVQGSDIPDDETEVRKEKELIETIKDFLGEAEAATEEDGETREVVILVKGETEEEVDDEERDEE